MHARDDTSLAEQLRPLLKPARGFAPKLSHIRAALLMARDDSLSSREACRRASQPDDPVPQGARDRIAELKSRVAPLLDAVQPQPAQHQPPPSPPPQPPPPVQALAQPVMPQPSVPQTVATEDDLGLPPLQSACRLICARCHSCLSPRHPRHPRQHQLATPARHARTDGTRLQARTHARTQHTHHTQHTPRTHAPRTHARARAQAPDGSTRHNHLDATTATACATNSITRRRAGRLRHRHVPAPRVASRPEFALPATQITEAKPSRPRGQTQSSAIR